MYTVKAYYTTGDSFGSEDVEHEIPLVWENKELARQAMREIYDHYTAFQDRLDYSEVKDNAWCGEAYAEIWEFSIKLELDNGKRQSMNVPWTGYFESLNSLEVVIATEDMGEDRIIL